MLELPFVVMLDKQVVGEIVTYGYETPWACGQVTLYDDELLAQMLALGEFRQLELAFEEQELTEPEEERLWYAELERLGLTMQDLALGDEGRWSLLTADKQLHEMYAVSFAKPHFIEWRF